jgi:hypothetical protein
VRNTAEFGLLVVSRTLKVFFRLYFALVGGRWRNTVVVVSNDRNFLNLVRMGDCPPFRPETPPIQVSNSASLVLYYFGHVTLLLVGYCQDLIQLSDSKLHFYS